MDLAFSWAWFFGGLMVIIAGVAFLRFHEAIANNFGAGMADYERYKLYAVIAIGIGFLAMVNLVPLILSLLIHQLFGGGGGDGGSTITT